MKNYLFDFQSFIEELRDDEKKKEVVQNYEKNVLNGKPIKGDIKDQDWYKEYLSKIPPQKYRVPEDLENDFDWDVLFQLIAGSFSSEYWFAPITGSDLEELFVEVKAGTAKIKKKISELWSFQILRLFEIYCEEQMNLQNLFAESKKSGDKDEIRNFEKERKKKIAPHEKIRKSVTKILSPPSQEEEKKLEVNFYCSLESAFNIIKSGVLYSSDLSYMNDEDELTFGIDIMFAALKEIANKEDTSDELKSQLNTFINDKDYCQNIKNSLKKDFVYISCFSRKLDDLNQWRAYGDNGYGVCLHFDLKKLQGDSGSDDFYWGDVVYLYRIDEKSRKNLNKTHKEEVWEKQLEILEDMFTPLLKGLEQNNPQKVKILQQLLDLFGNIPNDIKRHIRFYKNMKFQEEEEFRLVCLNENKKYEEKIRIRNEYLVPYIEFPIRKIRETVIKREKGKLKVKEEWGESSLIGITIGPAVKDFEKAKRSFELFFKEFDRDNGTKYSDIPIKQSDIPYLP